MDEEIKLENKRVSQITHLKNSGYIRVENNNATVIIDTAKINDLENDGKKIIEDSEFKSE